MGDLLTKAAVDGAALKTDEHSMVDRGPGGVCMWKSIRREDVNTTPAHPHHSP